VGGLFIDSLSFASCGWKMELQYKNMVNWKKKHMSKIDYQWMYFDISEDTSFTFTWELLEQAQQTSVNTLPCFKYKEENLKYINKP